MNPYELTIGQALECMNQGELSAVELAKSCIKRIDAIEKNISAFVTIDREGALDQAQKADRERDSRTGRQIVRRADFGEGSALYERAANDLWFKNARKFYSPLRCHGGRKTQG